MLYDWLFGTLEEARQPSDLLTVPGPDPALDRASVRDEGEAVYRAFAAKYGREPAPPEERPELWYWRVVPR